MNEKLYKIFSERLEHVREKTKPSRIRKYWTNYLDKLGVDRQGKLMTMLVPCPPDQIQFKDPYGEEVTIRINKELALKILTIGYIPDE